jgi:hypothetical protein
MTPGVMNPGRAKALWVKVVQETGGGRHTEAGIHQPDIVNEGGGQPAWKLLGGRDSASARKRWEYHS